MINYFPSTHPWEYMWLTWEPAGMDADFAKIAGLGFNAVRLVIPPKAFGFPQPSAAALGKLRAAISIASSHGLQVQLTLFDLWREYARIDASKTWAAAIVAPYAGDPRLQSIELQNEIDTSKPVTARWAKAMIPYLIGIARGTPVTVSSQITISSLTTLKNALKGAEPDYYSYHYYGSASGALSAFRRARDIVAPKNLFIGETGLASSTAGPLAPPDSAGELAQRRYFETVEQDCRTLSLPPAAPWIFQDFAAGALGPTRPQKQFHFGLLRADGSEKPAAAWFRSYFGTRA
jgi:hypothetical protein